jgi:hypothetical protein
MHILPVRMPVGCSSTTRRNNKNQAVHPHPLQTGPTAKQQKHRLERLTDLPAGTIGLPPSRSCRRNAFQPAITQL